MNTVLRYTLRRFRGKILGWGGALFLLGVLTVSFYDTVVQQQDQIQELLKGFPPGMTAFFGDLTAMFTPHGYLSIRLFSILPVLVGIFMVTTGSGLVVGDEEQGTLDLVLAHPISRTELLMGRLLAFVLSSIGIMALGWLGLIAGMGLSTMEVSWGALALPYLSLLAVSLLFGMLALWLSLLLPSRQLAASVAGMILVASYFLSTLARGEDDLKPFARLSPLNYYQSGDALLGINWGWLTGLLAVAALFAALAWWSFERRDIRVGGESGWRMPAWRRTT